MEKRSTALRLLPYALSVLLGCGVAYLNLHTDEVPFVALPCLAATALIGFIEPRGAWRWALLTVFWPIFTQALALVSGARLPYPNTLGSLQGALIGLLIFGLAGAYVGAGGRRLLRLVRAGV